MLHGYGFGLSNDEWLLLDEFVRPEMKQAYETDKKNWLANLAREHPNYLSLNL